MNDTKVPPPLPSIQRDIVDKLWEDHTNLDLANVGDVWWLISSKWLDSWYVGFSSSSYRSLYVFGLSFIYHISYVLSLSFRLTQIPS